jgi:hypothetical protein
MSSWLYQFWLFAFKTAKHWGVGPRYWDASLLGFNASSGQSPRIQSTGPDGVPHNTESPGYRARAAEKQREPLQPSPLCHWSIHYECSIEFEGVQDPESSSDRVFDLKDPRGWHSWPNS